MVHQFAERSTIETDPLSAGLALAERGDVAGAAVQFRRATRRSPRCVKSWQNLGVAAGQLGRADEAEEYLRRAVALEPNYFQARLNLASALATADGSRRRSGQAINAFHDAVRLRPDSAEALSGLGLALTTAGRAAEAVVVLKQAVRLSPTLVGAHNNLGMALAELGRYGEAEQRYAAALALDPGCAEAHTNLGNALKEQGHVDAAIAEYDLALAGDGGGAARWNRSLALLQRGDFADGWREYESRWDRRDAESLPRFDRPAWDGSPLAGRTLLIWAEQGLGDAVQFARYGEVARAAGAGRVVFLCPSPLTSVMERCRGIDQVVPEGRALPAYDTHAPAMSMPRLCGTTLDAVPAKTPYLSPDPDRVQRWRQVLGNDCRLTVGIVWQGNPHHRWDRHRSVPLTTFEPLARVPGVRLVSLQRGPGTEQLADAAHLNIRQVLDPAAADPEAVADVLALAAAVDVVVTVDTLPAHLAGAAGAEVWVALSTLVDWRWMLGRDDSPWYPTMRLFRQSARGEWDQVFGRMADALHSRATTRAPNALSS